MSISMAACSSRATMRYARGARQMRNSPIQILGRAIESFLALQLSCSGYRSSALCKQWRLVALGGRRVWQSSQFRGRQSSNCEPRQTIAPAIPDTRGFGSPYKVPFGPFMFPVSCLVFSTNPAHGRHIGDFMPRKRKLVASALRMPNSGRRLVVAGDNAAHEPHPATIAQRFSAVALNESAEASRLRQHSDAGPESSSGPEAAF